MRRIGWLLALGVTGCSDRECPDDFERNADGLCEYTGVRELNGDLDLNVGFSCSDCAGDVQGGFATQWSIELENQGEDDLTGLGFAVWLFPEEDRDAACEDQDFDDLEGYSAYEADLSDGECDPLESGDVCTSRPTITLPNAQDGEYVWWVWAWHDDYEEEEDKADNFACGGSTAVFD